MTSCVDPQKNLAFSHPYSPQKVDSMLLLVHPMTPREHFYLILPLEYGHLERKKAFPPVLHIGLEGCLFLL